VELPSGEKVTFPEGSLDEDTVVTLAVPASCEEIAPPPAGFAVYVYVGCVEAGPSGVMFDPPALLTLPYTVEDIAGLDATTLAIWVYVNEAWQLLGGVIDEAAGTVTVEVPHFTTYGLFAGLAASAGEDAPAGVPPMAGPIVAPDTGSGPSGDGAGMMLAVVALAVFGGALSAGAVLARRR
jgi:hypothetical protein